MQALKKWIIKTKASMISLQIALLYMHNTPHGPVLGRPEEIVHDWHNTGQPSISDQPIDMQTLYETLV